MPIIENTPFEHDLSDSMAQVRDREREIGVCKDEMYGQKQVEISVVITPRRETPLVK